jgi:hypothetical protein
MAQMHIAPWTVLENQPRRNIWTKKVVIQYFVTFCQQQSEDLTEWLIRYIPVDILPDKSSGDFFMSAMPWKEERNQRVFQRKACAPT